MAFYILIYLRKMYKASKPWSWPKTDNIKLAEHVMQS